MAVTPAGSQQVSTKQDPLLVSMAEAPSVTRRWKSRAGLGSGSWALTSLGCPEGRQAPPASKPLTWDQQPLVSTALEAGSSFPAPEPLMSPAHRYLSLRSQLRCRLLRDPFLGSSRWEMPSWMTITLGHALSWTSPEDRERNTSPLCPPCPVHGRARGARAVGPRTGGRSAGPGWGDDRGASCPSAPGEAQTLLIFNLLSFCY